MSSLLFFGFLKKNGIKLLLIIMLSVVMATCARSRYGRPIFFPVDVDLPIDLSKARNASETEFRVFFDDQHELFFDFFTSTTNTFEGKELLKFVGGGGHEIGQIIPVKLLIMKLDKNEEKIIIEKEYLTQRVRGMSGSSLTRTLTVLHLEPGT